MRTGADELWWSRELLRIEEIQHMTVGLLSDYALNRVHDACQRILLDIQAEMQDRANVLVH